ncbi:DUF4190 domain-containing protein [Agromyces sp. ISL-38]|uniref:DUF4190 domain-containing protein n=1 Tax=Agromyces sp. ISL-38 TaxID=2819107 RepID=UPI001BE579DA|nr:DUF4190 domain-containing protein [Agromyces sp. ISL-38]MBT2500587.1 DUF4190 domain-containing protein [Agromyces sp. ISL-38]
MALAALDDHQENQRMDATTTTPTATYVVPAAVPAEPPHNVLAWVSLGLAVGFVFFGPLTSIPAIITGHLARSQIRAKGELGDAAALTGLVLGYVFSALSVLGVVAFVVFIIGIAAAASNPYMW